jgi:hypothetical protein
MSSVLKKNIYDSQTPGALTSEAGNNGMTSYLSVCIQYACRYLVDYLQRGEIGLCDDNEYIYKFL